MGFKESKENLIVDSDCDGVLVHSYAPFRTLWSLARMRFSYTRFNPNSISEYQRKQSANSLLDKVKEQEEIRRHKNRKVKHGVYESLTELRSISQSINVVSGRGEVLRPLTINQLQRGGIAVREKSGEVYEDRSKNNIDEHLINNIYLNPGLPASVHKGWIVYQQINHSKGVNTRVEPNIVFFEDDLRAALVVASVNPQITVYLINNISNLPLLLVLNRIKLPKNVHRANNLPQAVDIFKSTR